MAAIQLVSSTSTMRKPGLGGQYQQIQPPLLYAVRISLLLAHQTEPSKYTFV